MKKKIILIAMALMLVSGCGNTDSSAEKNVQENLSLEETSNVTNNKSEEMEEATPEPTSEPTPEPTPEPTAEPVVYEGIDMESTLPGDEWIATSFPGIIDTPKLVVYNDTTNKKVIVEEGQAVEFAKNDILAIYVPEGTGITKIPDLDNMNKASSYGTVTTVKEVSMSAWEAGRVVTENVVVFNDEELTLTAILLFTE